MAAAPSKKARPSARLTGTGALNAGAADKDNAEDKDGALRDGVTDKVGALNEENGVSGTESPVTGATGRETRTWAGDTDAKDNSAAMTANRRIVFTISQV